MTEVPRRIPGPNAFPTGGGQGAAICARVYSGLDTSVPPVGSGGGAGTAISFTNSRFDTGDFWSPLAPTRFTIPETGIYQLWGHAAWEANVGMTTATRQIRFEIGGTQVIAIHNMIPVTPTTSVSVNVLATIWSFTAGEYVEMVASQRNSGAVNVKVITASDYSPEFGIARLA